MYWENNQVDMSIFQNEKIAHPENAYTNTLFILNMQREKFQKEIPIEASLGLLKIDSLDLKKELEPSPTNLIKQFETFMPPMLKKKNN